MNGQVLVFNTDLSLYDAINALAEHNIFCGVMWDEANKAFLDLFTIRDIMEILILMTEQLEAYKPGEVHTLPSGDQNIIGDFIKLLSAKVAQGKIHMMEMEPEKPATPSVNDEAAAGAGYEILFGVLKSTKLSDWAKISNQIVR